MTAQAPPAPPDTPTATPRPAPAGRRPESAWLRRAPLLPALVFTIVVTQVPFLFSIYYSLTEWRVVPPTPRTFVGFENYVRGWGDPFFLRAAWTSVWMTVAAVLLSLVIGTALALLLDRKFPGRGVARTLMITPFLVMPVVAGLVWSNQMFSSQFGVLNWVITSLGFDAVSFVQVAPGWSIVTVLVWQWSPFMMLIVLAGLQGQPGEVLEAARVDGAGPFGIFRWITLPLLRPYLELGILLGSIYLVQVFDHIVVITGGGPGSTNIPYFVYQRSIGGGWDFGLASSFSILVVIASIIIATLALRLLSNLISKDPNA
ncbi:carbohydrate ABC transporter permease [Aquipuribacter sp. SD81]|uniref:carbohydrate ABC transporter permease n=1 Tax=Aquipuribacter sp. SD81 TaxID=3127703 RepID=UPI003018BF8F